MFALDMRLCQVSDVVATLCNGPGRSGHRGGSGMLTPIRMESSNYLHAYRRARNHCFHAVCIFAPQQDAPDGNLLSEAPLARTHLLDAVIAAT